jgi:xanthosine phosphorylase
MTYCTKAGAYLAQRLGSWRPQIAIVLGSGLGDVTQSMQVKDTIPYREIPDFFAGTVVGHDKQLVCGEWQGKKVVALQGRAHFYEGASVEAVQIMVRAMRDIGCEMWLATNAVGSLDPAIRPGQLVLINDHINFQGINPLVGANDEAVGPRFVALNDAYDADARQQLQEIAKQQDIALAEGVYIAVLGPSYETAAEIRAFRSWGADVVGMSTVPEVILARHCGMRVAVISTVTNMATGLSDDGCGAGGTTTNNNNGTLLKTL